MFNQTVFVLYKTITILTALFTCKAANPQNISNLEFFMLISKYFSISSKDWRIVYDFSPFKISRRFTVLGSQKYIIVVNLEKVKKSSFQVTLIFI